VVSHYEEPGILASDADRDAVATVLSESFAAGRLTAHEHAERVRAAYAARTRGDLALLTADLPAPAGDAGHPVASEMSGSQPGRGSWPAPDGCPGSHALDRCLLCTLLVLCRPAGIAWLLAGRRRSRRGQDQAAGLEPAAAGTRRTAAGAAGIRAEDR